MGPDDSVLSLFNISEKPNWLDCRVFYRSVIKSTLHGDWSRRRFRFRRDNNTNIICWAGTDSQREIPLSNFGSAINDDVSQFSGNVNFEIAVNRAANRRHDREAQQVTSFGIVDAKGEVSTDGEVDNGRILKCESVLVFMLMQQNSQVL